MNGNMNMFITFDLRDTDATSGDYIMIDNVRDLRVTDLFCTDVYLKAKEIFKVVQDMPDYICKWWQLKARVVEIGTEQPYLLEFESNGKHYFIITEGKTYIANDEDITIKTLN